MKNTPKMIKMAGLHFVKLECNLRQYKITVAWFGHGMSGVLHFTGFDAWCISSLFDKEKIDFRQFAHNMGYVHKKEEIGGFMTAS